MLHNHKSLIVTLSPADCLALTLGEAFDACDKDAAERWMIGRLQADWQRISLTKHANLRALGFHCHRNFHTPLYHEAKAQPGRNYGEALRALFDTQTYAPAGMIPGMVVEAAFGEPISLAAVVRLTRASGIA